MAKLLTLEETKTYATEENAVKAFQKKFGDADNLRFFIMRTAAGRFYPVALLHAGDETALALGVHFHFHVIG
jgi:hypothetical protein